MNRRKMGTGPIFWGLVGVLGVHILAAEARGKRIVSLAPSITETLFAIGAGENLVGVSEFCDWPPPAKKIDRVGSYLQPNVEAIVAHRPDLVLAVPSPGNREAVASLERLRLHVVVVAEGPRLSDVFASVKTIADQAGRSEAGGLLVESLRQRIERTTAKLRGVERRQVLVVLQRSPLVVVGDGNLVDELLGLAGAQNAARGLGAWPRLSLEYVVKTSPEVILDTAMGKEEAPDLSFYEGLGLAAVRQGRVYAVKLDEILRPGPRIATGLEKLARLIHPEIESPMAAEREGGP